MVSMFTIKEIVKFPGLLMVNRLSILTELYKFMLRTEQDKRHSLEFNIKQLIITLE